MEGPQGIKKNPTGAFFKFLIFTRFTARNALFEGPFWPEKGENDKIFKNAPVGFFLLLQRPYISNMKVLAQKTQKPQGFEISRGTSVRVFLILCLFIIIRACFFLISSVVDKIFGWGKNHWKARSQLYHLRLTCQNGCLPPPIALNTIDSSYFGVVLALDSETLLPSLLPLKHFGSCWCG